MYKILTSTALSALLFIGCGGGSTPATAENNTSDNNTNTQAAAFKETNITSTEQAEAVYKEWTDILFLNLKNKASPAYGTFYALALAAGWSGSGCTESGTIDTSVTSLENGNVDQKFVFANCAFGDTNLTTNFFGAVTLHNLTEDLNTTDSSRYELDELAINTLHNGYPIHRVVYDGNVSIDETGKQTFYFFSGSVSSKDFETLKEVRYRYYNFPTSLWSPIPLSHMESTFSVTHSPRCDTDGNYTIRYNDINLTSLNQNIIISDGGMVINNAVFEFLYAEKQTPTMRVTVGHDISIVDQTSLSDDCTPSLGNIPDLNISAGGFDIVQLHNLIQFSQ